MKIRLINKSDNKVFTFRNVEKVSTFLLGKRLSNWIIVKSENDDTNTRIIEVTIPKVCMIEKDIMEG